VVAFWVKDIDFLNEPQRHREYREKKKKELKCRNVGENDG
jgi:hypothetical protein